MIPGMIPAASPAAGAQTASMTSGMQDKGFNSILKNSINDAVENANNDSTARMRNTGVKSAKDSTGSKDAIDPKNKAEDQQVQDPAEVLRQLVLQMTSVAQQVINQSSFKDVSAGKSSEEGQAAQALQSAMAPAMSDLAKEVSQLSSAVQASTEAQGGNFPASLALNQDNTANKIDLKLFDKIAANSKDLLLNALKGHSQDSSMNVLPAADSVKTEAELQAFGQGGKDAAFLSKTAESADEALSQFKVELNSGSGETGDKSNSRVSSGLYAQGIQAQTSSVHEQSPIQETVPANRLASLDEVISKALDSGQKNLVIRIDPPDLGSMHIRLSLDNGVLKADVRVDSSSVKDSFNLALPQIKTSLENSGIKISEFHVDVREDQYRNGQERNNQGQQQRQDKESRNGFSDFFA
jgi:flagellar hook-length control protein FliK